MSDDTELLRQIAEIEGLQVEWCKEDVWPAGRPQGTYALVKSREKGWHYYNPLTNDADAFALIEKYMPEIMTPDPRGDRWDVNLGKKWHSDADLKRAICLAVVASKEVGCVGEHTWVDPSNAMVKAEGYEVCVKCGLLKVPESKE